MKKLGWSFSFFQKHKKRRFLVTSTSGNKISLAFWESSGWNKKQTERNRRGGREDSAEEQKKTVEFSKASCASEDAVTFFKFIMDATVCKVIKIVWISKKKKTI